MRILAAALTLGLLPLVGCGGDETTVVTDDPLVVDETTDAMLEDADAEIVDDAEMESAMAPEDGDDDNPLGLEPGQTLYYVASAQAGDRACYLSLEPTLEDGPAIDREASFEICEMDILQGQNIVIVEEEESNVMAASCEGDMDCTDVDVVNLITEVRLVSL